LSRIRYLLDEDTPHAIRDQLLRRKPEMEVLVVGDDWEAGRPKEYRDRVEYLPL